MYRLEQNGEDNVKTRLRRTQEPKKRRLTTRIPLIRVVYCCFLILLKISEVDL